MSKITNPQRSLKKRQNNPVDSSIINQLESSALYRSQTAAKQKSILVKQSPTTAPKGLKILVKQSPTTAPKGLKSLVLRFRKRKFDYLQVGRIDSIGDGIARVYGLDGVKAGELIEFVGKSGVVVKGMALNLEKDYVGSVLFGSDSELVEGDLARRTKSIISVPVGLFLRGRVVDPLGQPLDDKGALVATKPELVERKAPGIKSRARINSPMATGIRAVDSLVPIGNGCIGHITA